MANFNIDYLVVAGGGAGASGYGGIQGGGGGGGGFITSLSGGSGGGSSSESPFTLTAGTQYAVTVGAGGQNVYTLPGATPTSGGDSSAFNGVTALGGGNARSYTAGNNLPSAGSPNYASGGGGTYTGGSGGSNPGSGTSVSRGYSGGNGTSTGSYYGGGGGGAGGAGSTTVGGAGKLNSLTGNTSLSYSGGGGNSWGNPRGGAGQSALSAGNGNAAINNTGGGGGGGRGNSGYGGNGGSGIIILRYPTADVAGYTTTGLTPTETTVGTDTVLSFTTVGTGTITFTALPTPTRISSALVNFNSGTEIGLKIPSGDDANQPTGVQGMIRNNIDSGMSFYDGSEWISLEATTPPLSTVTLTNSWRAWDTASFVNGNNSCTDVTGGLVLGPYSSGSPGAFFYGSFNNVAGNKYWVMNGGGSHARRAGFSRPTEFTVSYWGNKPNNPGFNSERAIWSFNVNGANSIRLARRNNANTQSLRIYSGNSAIATFADGITTNTWYNITLTFSSNTVKTYVGVQGSTNTTLINTTTLSSGNFPTGVSNDSNGTGFWIATNSGYTDWLTDSWSGLNIYDGVARQAEIDTIVSNGYQQ